MAFFGRLGGLLRNAANKQISSEMRSSPSFFQAIRCMSSAPSTKLFIGGISFNTDEQGLEQEFVKYGEVREAKIIVDRESGRSRGFGFVTYNSVEEATSALQALDGQELHGRRIRVDFASERPRSYGGGSGTYGGGSYGNGSGYGGDYGRSPYGGASTGGYGTGGNYGSGAGNDYSSPGSFGTNNAGGNYGNDGNFTNGGGNFGVAGGVGGHDSFTGGNAGGVGGHDSFTGGNAGGVGGHDSFTGGNAGNTGFASSEFDGGIGTGQFNSQGSNNVDEGLGGFGDSVEGNFRDGDDDSDNFAKRA